MGLRTCELAATLGCAPGCNGKWWLSHEFLLVALDAVYSPDEEVLKAVKMFFFRETVAMKCDLAAGQVSVQVLPYHDGRRPRQQRWVPGCIPDGVPAPRSCLEFFLRNAWQSLAMANPKPACKPHERPVPPFCLPFIILHRITSHLRFYAASRR